MGFISCTNLWSRTLPGNKIQSDRRALIYLAILLVGAASITASLLVMQGTTPWSTHPLAMLFLATVTLVLTVGVPVAMMRLLHPLAIRPSELPRMDYSGGIPLSCSTLLVTPILLDGSNTKSSIDTLEQHYLANPDLNLTYALLSDFADADRKVLPSDESIIDALYIGIDQLNRKYGEANDRRFVFLHRGRSWSEQDGKWMGGERKRGKLKLLNSFLLGQTQGEAFIGSVDGSWRSNLRYVITLDADNRLEPGGARALIEIISHPSHQVRYNERGRVKAGYVILQPRPIPESRQAAPTLYECWAR